MISLFVTGTDTGVGKTTVACALLAAARARGLRPAAMKPVETGCADPRDPRAPLVPADAMALEHAARGDRAPAPPPSNLFRFAAPLAPSVAATREGGAVSIPAIQRAADRICSLAPDLFLVEGAGGLLVPLSDDADMTDLARALALPLLIVARDGLGTINHTLLTLEAAAARRLPVAAVILSAAQPGTSDADWKQNQHEIHRRGRTPVLGRLPHIPDAPLGALADAAERHLALDQLFGPGQ